MKRVGLIVNPIAGMGGPVGLKGTDGPETARRARELGAAPRSAERAKTALQTLLASTDDEIRFFAASGAMGEDSIREIGIVAEIVGPSCENGSTGPEDTRRAAQQMVARDVDLLLFAGGDGTARDIYEAVQQSVVVLGIPTGVKMHSSVFATTPGAAGRLAAHFLSDPGFPVRSSEVMDIDEAAFRLGRVSAELFGYLNVPFEHRLVQGMKSGASTGVSDFVGIAQEIEERMEDSALWIVGPGTTTRAIAERLDEPKTLLGVDLFRDRQRVAADVTDQDILTHLDEGDARIVVTPIGGQGYLFGRGNQQVSPEVIRRVGKSNIVVVATRSKMVALQGDPLLVDTGDPELDESLRGFVRVITGYHQESVARIA